MFIAASLTTTTPDLASNVPPPPCSRSRLFGMPLADRHAALTVACSLRHRLPRRALVNFFCRLILGKDIVRLPPASSSEVRLDLSLDTLRRS